MARNIVVRDRAAHAGLQANRVSLRSLQFGIASWLLLFLMFASFGPWFRLEIAYVLAGSSILMGAVGISRADATLQGGRHRTQGHRVLYAASGLFLSILAILVSLAYTGLLGLFLFPYFALFVAPFALLFLLVRVTTPACTGCGRRTERPSVSSRDGDWLCSGCAKIPWGVGS